MNWTLVTANNDKNEFSIALLLFICHCTCVRGQVHYLSSENPSHIIHKCASSLVTKPVHVDDDREVPTIICDPIPSPTGTLKTRGIAQMFSVRAIGESL